MLLIYYRNDKSYILISSILTIAAVLFGIWCRSQLITDQYLKADLQSLQPLALSNAITLVLSVQYGHIGSRIRFVPVTLIVKCS